MRSRRTDEDELLNSYRLTWLGPGSSPFVVNARFFDTVPESVSVQVLAMYSTNYEVAHSYSIYPGVRVEREGRFWMLQYRTVRTVQSQSTIYSVQYGQYLSGVRCSWMRAS
jgi:hypothetical protein